MSDTSPAQILVVDDSKVIRRAAVKILEKEYAVLEAEDGADAWNQIQTNKAISVVFSDLGMPNMDGYQLLENIRKSDDTAISRLPVIIITGAEESDGAKQKVFEHGATDFISKPFDSVSLRSRAQAHINYQREVQALEQRVSTDKVTGLHTEAAFKQLGEQTLAYALRPTILGMSRIPVKALSRNLTPMAPCSPHHPLRRALKQLVRLAVRTPGRANQPRAFSSTFQRFCGRTGNEIQRLACFTSKGSGRVATQPAFPKAGAQKVAG